MVITIDDTKSDRTAVADGCSRIFCMLRNRIDAARMPGVASAQSLCPQNHSGTGTMFAYCLMHVFRATGIKAAVTAKIRTYAKLVAPQKQSEDRVQNVRSFSCWLPSSCNTSCLSSRRNSALVAGPAFELTGLDRRTMQSIAGKGI